MFVNILNNVIGKNIIDDNEKLGKHLSSENTDKIILGIRESLMSNPSEFNEIKKEFSPKMQIGAKFFEAFPPPIENQRETKNIYRSLTVLETTKFLKKCKKEGVSVHSAFCTIANSVIAKMLHDSGLSDDCFVFKHRHSINIRRYWSENTPNALGPHIGLLTMAVNIHPATIHSNFWDNARAYHERFNEYINEKLCFKQIILMLSMGESFFEENDDSPLENVQSYYDTTNLGNLDTTFTGEGEYVQVMDIRRSTSTDKVLCSHVFHTFRGRFIYGLDYNTRLMSSETANLYVTSIFKFLQNICQD